MDILQALNWRYATKQFDTHKKLSKQEVDDLLEAARLAPSSFGLQPWGFVLASKTHDPMALTRAEIESRHAARGVSNKYYTGRFHQACFTLPEYLERAVEEQGRILTDAEPFVWDA